MTEKQTFLLSDVCCKGFVLVFSWCMLQRKPFLFFQFVSKDLIWWCRDIWQGQGLLVALQVGFGQFPPWKWINCSVFISYEQPPTLLSLHGWSLVSFLRTVFYLQSKWFSSQCTSFHKKSSAPVWKLLRHKSHSHPVVPHQLLSPQLSPTSFSGTHSCPTQAKGRGPTSVNYNGGNSDGQD